MENKFIIILQILFILIIACSDSDRKNNNDNKAYINKNIAISKFKMDNITNLTLINLTEKDKRINKGLFSSTNKDNYLIDKDWNLYSFDLESYSIIEKKANINTIEKDMHLKKDEKIIHFIYYEPKSLIQIKTLTQSTSKISHYLIDVEKNKLISFKPNEFLNKSSAINKNIELAGTYDEGNKAVLLSYKKEETWSDIYLTEIDSKKTKTIIKNCTVLGYSFSDDRKYFVFFGNINKKLSQELYDYTSRGNFFMYYPEKDNNEAYLYILDLTSKNLRKIPNSYSYYYAWMYNNMLRIETNEGEFIIVDSQNGKMKSDISFAVYKIMGSHKESFQTKESNSYTLTKHSFNDSQEESLVYISKKSNEEITLLSLNRYISNIIAINDEYALFSVVMEDFSDNSNKERIYLIKF